MKKHLLAYAVIIMTAIYFYNSQPNTGQDGAIIRVENCECLKTLEAQKLKPWELDWESDKLRDQLSYCTCEATIDIRKVEDPKRYFIKGTTVR